MHVLIIKREASPLAVNAGPREKELFMLPKARKQFPEIKRESASENVPPISARLY
jgi:hypothetical protein